MRRPSLLLAALAALGGCSLSADVEKLDPLATAEGYCQTWVDLVTSRMATCGATAQLAAVEYEQALPLCAALGGSSVRYDREAAEECVAYVRSLSCAPERVADSACDRVFAGTLGEGEPCLSAVECSDSEAECVDPELACGRTCVSPGTVDEPCGGNYPACATGHYCWTGEGRCVSALGEGESCTTAWSCGTGAYCDALGACRRYATEGEACDPRLCEENELFCDQAAPTPVCKPWSSLVPGQGCTGPRQCRLDSYCDGSTSRCVLAKAEGASCAREEECMPPLNCVGDTIATAGTCLPARAPGESCTPESFDCVWGAACVGGVDDAICVSWPDAYDAPCSPAMDGGCLVGRCAPDGSDPMSATCEAFRSPGESCMYDRDCGAAYLTEAGGRCSGDTANRACAPSCL